MLTETTPASAAAAEGLCNVERGELAAPAEGMERLAAMKVTMTEAAARHVQR